MRILITGSRDWTDGGTMLAAIRELWQEWAHRTPEDSTDDFVVVHGDCPSGADYMADRICSVRLVTLERHPADWATHGKRAGFVRNAEMVALGADVCLAFIKNESKGATMTADLAEKAGIRTVRFTA
jgi:hypothetical protein